MFAHTQKRRDFFSYLTWSTTRRMTAWLALPVVALAFGSNVYAAGCGGGGCSSGGGSPVASSPYGANPMANHAGRGGSSTRGGGMQHPMEPAQAPMPSMGASQTGPHGGQLSILKKHQAEVVFTAKETRVYLYTATGEPLAARGVQGTVAMKILGIEKIYRYAFQEASDARNKSFLVVQVDASRLRDGDMEATFQLTGLPMQDEPRAGFSQTFALAQSAASTQPMPSGVRQVATTQADLPLIAKQKTCPITKGPLDSMGGPVKLMIGDKPLFVCCAGCIDQVKSNPAMYLAMLNR
ncbi:MAG: hypothetical protein GXP26_02060 [Planctomycetes bacterium]|nr:hypothetical protein [Planctomycetota bacterium]